MNKRSCENCTNDHKQKQRCIQRINNRKRSFDEIKEKCIRNEYNQINPDILYDNIIYYLKSAENNLQICKTPNIRKTRKNYEIESLLRKMLNDIQLVHHIQM